MKVLYIGHPRSGKTTKARTHAAVKHLEESQMIHTDKLVSQYEWSVFSDKVCDLLKQPGPWIIEGCSAVRGLRKYLKEGHVPDFQIIWLDRPYIPLEGRQLGFASSLTSIWEECQELIKKNKATQVI